METRVNEMDRAQYLALIEEKTTDTKVIELVKEDIKVGLTIGQIDDYMNRPLSYEQRKAISDMYRKNFPASIVGAIGNTKVDANDMRIAMKMYEKGFDTEDILKFLSDEKVAPRKSTLDKVVAAADEAESSLNNEKEETKETKIPDYVDEILSEIRGLIQKISQQEEKYSYFSEKLKEVETLKRDEKLIESLRERIRVLEKENRELSFQLSNSQDELSKKLSTELKLKNEIEEDKKEISKMQDTINEYMIKVTDSENHKNDVVIEYTANKTSVLQRMANYMFKSKSRRTFLKLVVNKELTPEQVTQIRYGLEKRLTEEQLALIINKSLSPEKIKSIVEFAALENELKSERRG